MKQKICTLCEERKYLKEFYTDRTHKDGFASRCKTCNKKAQRRARAEDPEKARNYVRKTLLKQNFGMTLEDWDAMLAKQNGVCAICGGPPNGRGRYHVDHCHTTGTVRGLLCHCCNLGLGNFKDTPELLVAAIDYLTK